MAIKRAQYSQTKVSGEDVYHFQTDGKMVKILDESYNELGTLEEFGFTGKVVNGGSFKDLKVSGNYVVKGLTDLPTGFSTDKISILSIKSVGKVGSPDLIIYNLYGQSGESYQNTVTKTGQSGWTEGGTTLKNSLTTIQNQIGTLSNLKTTSKISVVGAVNELKSSLDSHASTLNSHATTLASLASHNHDDKYIKKDGDQNVGNISIQRGKSISGNLSTGGVSNLASFSTNNVASFGDKVATTKLYGKDAKLTYNDRFVWTETNMGSGSGLDADMLDGHDSLLFPRVNKDNTYTHPQRFNNAVVLNGGSAKFNRIVYKDANDKDVTTIRLEDSGRIRFQLKDALEDFILESNGKVVTFSDITISSEHQYAGMRFRRFSSQKGKGLELDRGTQSLLLHDWDNGKTGFSFGSDGIVKFPSAPMIQGNRLFIQAATPSGATKGDIWIDI